MINHPFCRSQNSRELRRSYGDKRFNAANIQSVSQQVRQGSRVSMPNPFVFRVREQYFVKNSFASFFMQHIPKWTVQRRLQENNRNSTTHSLF